MKNGRARRRQALWALAAVAVLSLSAAAAGAESVIPWDSAVDHAGRRITVEGLVVQARRVGSSTVLEFAPDDPAAFTVKLFQPIFRREPSHPETYYRGKLIRATGVVKQFQGRPEMIIRNAKQIAVVTDAPPQPEPPDGHAVDAPTAAAVTATVPPTNPPVVERFGAADRARCATARTEWRKLHPKMQQALGSMQECLRQERAQCGTEIDGLYAALADFDAAQAKLDEACEGQ